ELHTRLLRENLFHSFDELYPGKINNKTNGVTPRRWLLSINRGLGNLINEKIGKDWVTNLDQLRGLEAFIGDPEFLNRVHSIKLENKEYLSKVILRECGVQ